jgi:hypothetical protein
MNPGFGWRIEQIATKKPEGLESRVYKGPHLVGRVLDRSPYPPSEPGSGFAIAGIEPGLVAHEAQTWEGLAYQAGPFFRSRDAAFAHLKETYRG